jgi:hypothetical protein
MRACRGGGVRAPSNKVGPVAVRRRHETQLRGDRPSLRAREGGSGRENW